MTSPARAQADPDASLQQMPTPTPPTTQGSDVPSRRAAAPQAATTESAKFRDLDRLTLKGWVTAVPTYEDTLTRDAGGWRSKLANLGIGVSVYSLDLVSYDLAGAGRGLPGPQLYNGQKFTYQSGNQTALLTYDLGRVSSALKGGQIAAIFGLATNGYEARDGLRGFRIKGLSWYQPILSGKVELQAGLIGNQTEYMGTTVGGDLAGGALGPLASIPVEAGLSYSQYAAPTISARVNWTKYLYTRTGVQRSISPQGSSAENAANPLGLDFSVANAKPLVIQEIGYRVSPSAGVKSLWIRGDALYNTSNYKSFADGSGRNNYYVFAAVDRQFTQPDRETPGRGLYAGLTYTASPGSVNLINRYYEARAYLRGPFVSRPDDMISVVAAFNGYSAAGRDAEALADFRPYANTQSYTASYKFKITHGLYIQPGLSVIVHPVYTQNIGTALNGLLNIASFF